MEIIESALSRIELAEPQHFRNLTVVPMLDAAAGAAGYLLLDELMALGLAKVTEVSEGGSVPEVSFANLADRPVLLVDGEELVGARQNRILNLSILVAAGRKIRIPVSCVEQGRWAYRSRDFKAAEHKLYRKARAMKAAHVTHSLRERGDRRSDQGALWRDIDEKMARMQSHSPTASMEDLYRDHSERLSDYLAAFMPVPGQRGALFAINGKVVAGELFDSPDTYARYARKLLSSYALDALDEAQPVSAVPSETRRQHFFGEMAAARATAFPAVGEGEDLRLEGDRLAGGALAVDGRIVHLAVFRVEAEEDSGGIDKPMVA
jgi:hypothetical protein